MLDLHQIVRNCLQHALRPLVRLAIRNQITWKDMCDLIKRIYVLEGEQQLRESGIKTNVMRISTLTGIRRNDVKVLLEPELPEVQTNPGIATKVIDKWMHDPLYTTRKGKPRVLTYKGADSLFHQLVRSVTPSYSPKSVLSQLEATGVVETNNYGIRLIRQGFIAEESPEEGFKMLALDVKDLIGAVDQNLFSDKPVPNLHLTTEYDRLRLEDEQEIRDWLIEEGGKFHKTIRKGLREFEDRGKEEAEDSNPQKFLRVVMGTFSNATSVTEGIDGDGQ